VGRSNGKEQNKGEFKRDEVSLKKKSVPLSFEGEGDTGGEVTILNLGSLKNRRFFRVKRG